MTLTRETYVRRLHDLDTNVQTMGQLVLSRIQGCMAGLQSRDLEAAFFIMNADNEVDVFQRKIEEQTFLLLATQQPAAIDLRHVTASSTVASELERMGDYCAGIAQLTVEMVDEPPLGHLPTLELMSQLTQSSLEEALWAYEHRDVTTASRVWVRDTEVDDLYRDVFRTVLEDMAADRTSVRRGTYLLWVAHNVERMADRVTNIAERVAFVATGDVTEFRAALASLPSTSH